MSVCGECLNASVVWCEDIDVRLPLQASTDYVWKITDKFGNVYQGTETTDGSGYFTIDLDDLPDGLLNPEAGTFLLQIYRDGNLVTFEDDDENEYECINLSIHGGTGDAVIEFSGTTQAFASCQNNYSAVTNPAVTDDVDSGYCVGSEWINTSTNTLFKCTDNTAGAAVWMIISFT